MCAVLSAPGEGRRVTRVLAAIVLLVTLAGCGQRVTGGAVFYPTGQPPKPPASGPHVTMKYLGNGGWLIRHEKDVIATAPFFSNPRGLNVYLPGTSRTGLVDAKLGNEEMSDVRIMLVGHGHYDHAMDLPHILKTKAPAATLYGSKTVKHLLVEHVGRFADGTARVKDVTAKAPDGKTPGQWVPSEQASVRFMPLASDHAPHLLRFLKLVWWGSLDEDRKSLPITPWGWPEGETLAFLIDFLRDGKVVFRIYYQDAAAPPGRGIVPDLVDTVPVDVAILCVAGFDQVDDSPGAILGKVGPRYVVGGHWEDFFTPFVGKEPRVAMGTSLEKFVRLAHDTVRVPVFVPVPGETLSFPIQPR